MAIPVERLRLTEQVAEQLTTLIIEGTWAAGAALPAEGDLAQRFGVSRTVVRECVRVLATHGMLDVRQGRGTFVTPPAAWTVTEPLALLVRADRESLLSWLEVRTILEVESAALAAQRLVEADRAALRAALEGVEASGESPATYQDADIHFHLTIARAAHNASLVRLLAPMVQPLREQLRDSAYLPEARHAATREHRAIVERILAGDAPSARTAMARHLGRVAEEIGEVLRRGRDQETGR